MNSEIDAHQILGMGARWSLLRRAQLLLLKVQLFFPREPNRKRQLSRYGRRQRLSHRNFYREPFMPRLVKGDALSYALQES